MQRRTIIIACAAVAVLFLVYWFAFRTKAAAGTPGATAKAAGAAATGTAATGAGRLITAALTGFNYAGCNGNYTWAGTKTPKGAPIFKATAGNLASDQAADRLCVMYSPTNVRCWSSTGAALDGLDNPSGGWSSQPTAPWNKNTTMRVSGTADELAAALATAPVSNSL